MKKLKKLRTLDINHQIIAKIKNKVDGLVIVFQESISCNCTTEIPK